MEKVLKVPLVSQPEHSLDCGPACTTMVLRYFKKPATLTGVRSKLEYVDGGTYLLQNGTILESAGLKTEFVTAHPILFPYDIIRRTKTKADLMKWLSRFQKHHEKNKGYRNTLTHLRKYLRSGGKLRLEIPDVSQIVATINQGGLVIASIHGGALGRRQGYGYHFVVVDGYRSGSVHITNPWKPSRQRAWFPIERLMFAIHANTVFDLENGSLLLVTNRPS